MEDYFRFSEPVYEKIEQGLDEVYEAWVEPGYIELDRSSFFEDGCKVPITRGTSVSYANIENPEIGIDLSDSSKLVYDRGETLYVVEEFFEFLENRMSPSEISMRSEKDYERVFDKSSFKEVFACNLSRYEIDGFSADVVGSDGDLVLEDISLNQVFNLSEGLKKLDVGVESVEKDEWYGYLSNAGIDLSKITYSKESFKEIYGDVKKPIEETLDSKRGAGYLKANEIGSDLSQHSLGRMLRSLKKLGILDLYKERNSSQNMYLLEDKNRLENFERLLNEL
ncbi:MAG: hypothetical protein MUP58_01810 [Candidatus Nanohaloarchaeota archaeon QJJ-9]|nr:hypothetical protein [Candidatus Nanohaloarchaeota archaeon QJJ-9]